VTLGFQGELRDVQFVDGLHGWAVGRAYGPDGDWDLGVVLRTVDGGVTWQTSLLTDVDLETVTFGDALRGWVGGGQGLIMRTKDGGSTWEVLDSATAATVRDLVAVDPFSLWAVGSGGTVLRTRDGGGPALEVIAEARGERVPLAARLSVADVKD